MTGNPSKAEDHTILTSEEEEEEITIKTMMSQKMTRQQRQSISQ